MQKTLQQWKEWYQQEYGLAPTILYGENIDYSKQQKLVRIWIPVNGKVPSGQRLLAQGIFKDRKKKKAQDGLLVFRAPALSPIVLTSESYIEQGKLKFSNLKNSSTADTKDSKQKEKPRSLPLQKPYRWRCRDCGESGMGGVMQKHCQRQPKQLAPLSEEGQDWFENFLSTVKWKYVSLDKLMSIPNLSESKEALDIAQQAGQNLQQIMNELQLQCPQQYELYDRRNTHIRASDLKSKKGFNSALIDSIRNHGKTLSSLRTAPIGRIELGHIFDEFLSDICNQLVGDIWQKGQKIRYYSPSLKIAVSGTPDLRYHGIPVEMKTVETLPFKSIEPYKKVNFRNKVRSNFMTQVSIYSKAVDRQWILVLLISRQSGEFTVLPLSNETYLPTMEKKLLKWSQEPESAKLLKRYHQLKGIAEP